MRTLSFCVFSLVLGTRVMCTLLIKLLFTPSWWRHLIQLSFCEMSVWFMLRVNEWAKLRASQWVSASQERVSWKWHRYLCSALELGAVSIHLLFLFSVSKLDKEILLFSRISMCTFCTVMCFLYHVNRSAAIRTTWSDWIQVFANKELFSGGGKKGKKRGKKWRILR